MYPALDPEWNSAAQLLLWSKRNLTSNLFEEWPKGYPKPNQNRPEGSLLHQADEAFLCAIAWIIHHEIGHITLNHGSLMTVRSRDEESEADDRATEWVLDSVTDPEMITKRSYGVVTALMAVRGFSKGGVTHPEPEERLYKFLYSPAILNNESVRMFASVSMQLQSAAFGHSLSGRSDSIEDVLSGLLNGSIQLP